MTWLALSWLLAQANLGTADAPYRHVGSFTFEGDTKTASGSHFDSYSCAPTKPEQGPELIFAVVLEEQSDVDLIVESAGPAVDVDVHLLASLSRDAQQASDCIVRADHDTTAFHLVPGTYYVVADTYGTGAGKAGAFRLYVRVYPTARFTWTEIGRGVRWGRGSHDEVTGFSVLNVVDVDVTQGARVELLDNGSCKALGAMTLPTGVVAASNAGYFTSSCKPDGLLRIAGTTIEQSLHGRHAVGLHGDGRTVYAKPSTGSDWTAAPSAVEGAGYLDLRSGSVQIDEDNTTFGRVRHPRTVAGSAEGRQWLFTLDGRGDAGRGATFSIVGEVLGRLGATQGINFDGGSSTAMWISGEPSRGIVNFPSTSTTTVHAGVASVRSLAIVIAEPVARVAFVTLPDVREIGAGGRFSYSARAVVLGGVAVPVISAITLPESATFDGAQLVWSPLPDDNGDNLVVLRACVGTQCAEQRFTLVVHIPGGEEPSPSGPTGPSNPATGGDPGGSDGGGGPTGPSVVAREPVSLGAEPSAQKARSSCHAAGEVDLMWVALALSLRRKPLRRRDA